MDVLPEYYAPAKTPSPQQHLPVAVPIKQDGWSGGGVSTYPYGAEEDVQVNGEKKGFARRNRRWIILAVVALLIILAIVLGVVFGVVKKSDNKGTTASLESDPVKEGDRPTPTQTDDSRNPTQSDEPDDGDIYLKEHTSIGVHAWVEPDGRSEMHVYFQDNEDNIRDLVYSSTESLTWRSTRQPNNLFKGGENTPLAAAYWIESTSAKPRLRIYHVNRRGCLAEWHLADQREDGPTEFCYKIGENSDLVAEARNVEKKGLFGITISLVFRDDAGNVRMLRGLPWSSPPRTIMTSSFEYGTLAYGRNTVNGSQNSVYYMKDEETLGVLTEIVEPDDGEDWMEGPDAILTDEFLVPEGNKLAIMNTVNSDDSELTDTHILYQTESGDIAVLTKRAGRGWSRPVFDDALRGAVEGSAIACANPRKFGVGSGDESAKVEYVYDEERLSRCYFQTGKRTLREVSFWEGKWKVIEDITLF